MNIKQDHRLLGAKYDLFSFFDDYAPGLPVWHEKGLHIKNALISYWRKLHDRGDYKEIESPLMLARELWQISGHCDCFEDQMYFSSVDKRDYAIKPMNCPGAILYYKSKRRHYHELPLRICELGHVHRHELSGSLHGLMRVRSFVQDDAHIFCAKDQLLSEVVQVISLIEEIMQKCELKDYHFELSLKGANKNYLGNQEDWDFAQDILREALRDQGHHFVEKEGEAKFYGPSLDLHIRDIHARSWQCSSIQLDFNLPSRFGLCYYEESQKKVPFMLHRAIFGSLERFIGILLENFAMELPVWMHPLSYKLLSIGPHSSVVAKKLEEDLRSWGLSARSDVRECSLSEKLKSAFAEGAREIVIIGEQELKSSNVSLKKSQRNLSLVDFKREARSFL